MDSPVSRRQRGLRPLDEAQPGETVTVASVFERDRTLLEYLDGVGIRPGVRLEVASGSGSPGGRAGRSRVERSGGGQSLGPKAPAR